MLEKVGASTAPKSPKKRKLEESRWRAESRVDKHSGRGVHHECPHTRTGNHRASTRFYRFEPDNRGMPEYVYSSA